MLAFGQIVGLWFLYKEWRGNLRHDLAGCRSKSDQAYISHTVDDQRLAELNQIAARLRSDFQSAIDQFQPTQKFVEAVSANFSVGERYFRRRLAVLDEGMTDTEFAIREAQYALGKIENSLKWGLRAYIALLCLAVLQGILAVSPAFF